MKPRPVQTRHVVLNIETGELCDSPSHYDTASHALWDELYAILRGTEAPFYKRVKGVVNIECQASYCMQKGILFELLIEMECADGQVADLSKPALQKVLNGHWGEGAVVASKKVVPPIVQHVVEELKEAPVTFAVMAPEAAYTGALPEAVSAPEPV